MSTNVKIILIGVVIIVAVVLAAFFLSYAPVSNNAGNVSIATSAVSVGASNSVSSSTAMSALPGLSTAVAPWPPEILHLKERLSLLGLPALTQEGTVLHTHQHLDIYIRNQRVSVPADIGVDTQAGFISPVHTHDNTGVIHVESPTVQKFTLGQFFDVWGVRFNDNCLGAYCNGGNDLLKIFVNGQWVKNNVREIALLPHEEIVVTYGTVPELPFPLPTQYKFPAGL